MGPWPARSAGALALMAVVVVLAVSCGDSNGDASADLEVPVYAELIRRVVGDAPFAEVDDPKDVAVFVHPLEDDPIELDIQVEVLRELDEFATVRFVDSFVEAVEEDEPEVPVLEDGVVVGLGELRPLEGSDESFEVRAERYDASGGPRGLVFEARRSGQRWVLVATGTYDAELPELD